MRLTRLSVVFTAALAVAFTACPPVVQNPDGGMDGGEGVIPPEADRCAGGCGDNQICDQARRTCVEGCAQLATSIKANGAEFAGNWIKGTKSQVNLQGDLADGQQCNAAFPDIGGGLTGLEGKIVLCQRGGASFSTKANFVKTAGAAAIIIVNNEDLALNAFVEPAVDLVGVSISQGYGAQLASEVGQSITVTSRPANETPAGCPGGYCLKSGETFKCEASAVSCNGQICEPGQVACIAGECSCLSSLSGASDTCEAVGKWCNGKTCSNPRAWEECDITNLTATCGTGQTCRELFGDSAFCIKQCTSDNQCDRGDVCISTFGCLPAPIVADAECEQNQSDGDGGFTGFRVTVPIANTCLVKSVDGASGNVTITDPVGAGTGNCTYQLIKFWADGVYPYPVCRPPGLATLGQACRLEYGQTTTATQCSTGLQCVPTKGGDEGVCLKTCNAQPPAFGYDPRPECAADEACVNTLRYTDPNSNSVLGACMKKCSVFSADAGTCAPVGTTPASCVPTQASGELPVSLDGSGICIPQRASISQPYATCGETDSFKGAACGNAQLCIGIGETGTASCTPVCDLSCVVTDGGTVPAGCASRPNGLCAAGKTCTRRTSTFGARVGYCL
ncbi:MAG: PA domain-containing protein [Archangium sp.]